MTLLERYKFEEWCHDEWARSMSLDTLNLDWLFACPTTPENSYALSLLGDLIDKRLLDIGCGSGESSVFFAKRGAFVQAVDISLRWWMLHGGWQQNTKLKVAFRQSKWCNRSGGSPLANFKQRSNVPLTLH